MSSLAITIAKMIDAALAAVRVPAARISDQIAGAQVAPATTGGRGAVALSAATPQPLGAAAAGAAGDASDGAHTHAHGDLSAAGGTMHSPTQAGAEPALGNPASDGYVLSSTAGGVRSWAAAGGGVTAVTGTAPIVSSGGVTPAIAISPATTLAAGSLSAADKQKINNTPTAFSAVLPAYLSGDGELIIHVVAATPSAAGSMSAADKTKLDGVAAGATANLGTVTAVTGTAPIVSSGGAAPAISIAAATTGAAGSMSAADKAKADAYPAVSGLTAGAALRATAAGAVAYGAIDLANASAVTGTLPAARGGTGVSNAGTLTIPATGTAALRGASLSAGRVAVASDANTVDGSAALTWAGAVLIVATTAQWDGLRVSQALADNTAPFVMLKKSRAGGAIAANDYIGGLQANFINSAAADVSGAAVGMQALSATSGAERCQLTFAVRQGGAWRANALSVGGAGGGVATDEFFEMQEMTAPAAPAANGARLFLRDNGAGKTQLCVIFNSGGVIVLATQP